jgi:hypothetical protein
MRSYRLFFTHYEDDIDRAIVYLLPFKPSSLVSRRSARRRTGKGGATPLSSPLGKKAAERASERERGEEKGGLPCGAPPRVGRPTRSPQTQQQMAGKVGMKAMWFSTRGREDFGGRRPGFSCPSAGGEGLR